MIHTPKLFAMVGAAGYVAPKHMLAIKKNGGQLVAAYDPVDSMGVIDSFFPKCFVYNQWHKFHDAIKQIPIDYFVICSPNNHHMFHIEYGLTMADNVICEKPLVINWQDLEAIEEALDEPYAPYNRKKVYPILQLRDIAPVLHCKKPSGNIVSVKYHTPRGHWYTQSWKFNPAESGGLLMNIGIHLFDYLIFQFGDVQAYELDYMNGYHAAGYLELARARVKWELSIMQDKEALREFVVNDTVVNLTPHFVDAHARVYKNILAGQGHSLLSTRSAIKLVNELTRLGAGQLWLDFEIAQVNGWKI